MQPPHIHSPSSSIPLPPLGEDFLRHLCTTVARHYPKHSITAEELTQAFEALGPSPKFIRDDLSLRILNPLLAHEQALAVQRLEAEKESGCEDQFGQLLPLQRIVLVAMVSGQRELFSGAARRAMGSVLTGKTIGKPLLQRALRSLAEKGWIIRAERGEYLLADDLFAQWLREQIQSGLLRPPADWRGSRCFARDDRPVAGAARRSDTRRRSSCPSRATRQRAPSSAMTSTPRCTRRA